MVIGGCHSKDCYNSLKLIAIIAYYTYLILIRANILWMKVNNYINLFSKLTSINKIIKLIYRVSQKSYEGRNMLKYNFSKVTTFVSIQSKKKQSLIFIMFDHFFQARAVVYLTTKLLFK